MQIYHADAEESYNVGVVPKFRHDVDLLQHVFIPAVVAAEAVAVVESGLGLALKSDAQVST